MRSGACKPEQAQEVLDIWAPLASQLGVWYMKAQLEDGAFKVSTSALPRQQAGCMHALLPLRYSMGGSDLSATNSSAQAASGAKGMHGRQRHLASQLHARRASHRAVK